MLKGLEALQNLRCAVSLNEQLPYKEMNDLCDIVEKELKVLKIITRELNVEIEEDKGTYFLCITEWYIEIPKKEYNLLKEILC